MVRAISMLLAAVFGLAVLTPDISQAHDGKDMKFMKRHKAFFDDGVPAPYTGRTRPANQTPNDIATGAQHYKAKCAMCHGKDGGGDGPMAGNLKPKPGDLRWLISKPRHGDDFLLWSIMEGGRQFKTLMPPFKTILGEAEVWQVIGFMRREFAGKAAMEKMPGGSMYKDFGKGMEDSLKNQLRHGKPQEMHKKTNKEMSK